MLLLNSPKFVVSHHPWLGESTLCLRSLVQRQGSAIQSPVFPPYKHLLPLVLTWFFALAPGPFLPHNSLALQIEFISEDRGST